MARRKPEGYLVAVDPILLQPRYPLFGDGARIGRDADTCQVIVADDYVSRNHCELRAENGAFALVDLSTTNGTYVNGKKIDRRALAEGDEIGCGRPSPPHFIYSKDAPADERTYILPLRDVYSIGRTPENDLPLPTDPTVSVAHARIRRKGAQLVLNDLGSANGTYVNGRPVTTAPIGPDDVVQIGSIELYFELGPDELRVRAGEKRNRVRLEAVNISRQLRDRYLLRDISLVIEPGEFIGVLGPSGAGKSTLLNALNGFNPATSGEVLLNGTSLYPSYEMLKTSIGYVPQDDIIHKELTVERSLLYTAQLRLPRDFDRESLNHHVTSVIETLGLSHVRDSFVSQLSGGQRKRVSIGCELLTRPSLLFLDEPTSGLDPSTEEKLMLHFRQMSEQGQTVILTTHILYNLELFDKVILLSRGRLVYFGPVEQLRPFFSEPDRAITSPIEVFDVLEPESPDPNARDETATFFEQKFRTSPLSHLKPTQSTGAGELIGHASKRLSPASKIKRGIASALNVRQLAILIRRIFDLKLSFPSRLLVPLATPLLMAFLTATITVESPDALESARAAFEADNAAALQMMNSTGLVTGEEFVKMRFEGLANLPIPLGLPLLMVMTAVFLGTLSACLEISAERPIYLRERAVNLSIPLYVASKLPALFLLAALQCFIYVLLSIALLRISHVDVFTVLMITIGIAWVSCTIGLFLSSLDPTQGQNSVVLAVLAVLPQLLFSGAMGPGFYGGMNTVTQWVAAVFPARWGFELMLTALYERPAWVEGFITGPEGAGMGFRFGSDVYWSNTMALIGLGAAYAAATCLSLKRYDRL